MLGSHAGATGATASSSGATGDSEQPSSSGFDERKKKKGEAKQTSGGGDLGEWLRKLLDAPAATWQRLQGEWRSGNLTRNFQSAAAGAAAKLDEALNIGEGLNGASRALASVLQPLPRTPLAHTPSFRLSTLRLGWKSGHHEKVLIDACMDAGVRNGLRNGLLKLDATVGLSNKLPKLLNKVTRAWHHARCRWGAYAARNV
jgi:hypothetical protein